MHIMQIFYFSITALAYCNTSSEGRQSLWKSLPSCKLTKTWSSKPTANLLIITYLQRPWGRRSCKNTFDIVYTQMFFSPACCNEVSLRLLQQIPLQHVGCRDAGWNNTSTCIVPCISMANRWIGLMGWYLADGYSIGKKPGFHSQESGNLLERFNFDTTLNRIKQGQTPTWKNRGHRSKGKC